MMEQVLVAAAIMLILDLSAYVYGRSFLALDESLSRKSYIQSFKERFGIILTTALAFYIVVMPSGRPLLLRVALLCVVLAGYAVITFRSFKGSQKSDR